MYDVELVIAELRFRFKLLVFININSIGFVEILSYNEYLNISFDMNNILNKKFFDFRKDIFLVLKLICIVMLLLFIFVGKGFLE